MKLLIKVSLIYLMLLLFGCGKTSNENQPIAQDYPKHPDFNPDAFVVFDKDKELPSQTEDINGDKNPDRVLFLTDLNSKETKDITIRYSKEGVKTRKYTKRTQAVLGDYKLVKGEYTGGRFVDVDSAKVPANHIAHDALYRIEGPGWESDLITYRFYLDSRNRNDIFGKKVHELVLQKIGVNDLVSNSKESYTKMLDWGMDIFKVGESLGIGSIGIWYDNKVYTVSKTDSVICIIADNGPIRSEFNRRCGKFLYRFS